jgi:hypothetical protein
VSTTPVANLPPVSSTPAANIATGTACVSDTGGKLPSVSTTMEASLPPVSTPPVANKKMGTISGCRHLKLNLKATIYIYVNSPTQTCSNKIIKIFLIKDFFHLPSVSTTPVVHLEPRISPQSFEKI